MDIPLPGEDIPLPPPPPSQCAPMPPSVPLSNVPLPPVPYVGGLPRPPTFARPPYIGVPPHVMGMPPPIFNRPPPPMHVGIAPPPAGPPLQHQQMTAPPSNDDSSRYSPSAAMFDSDSGGEDPTPVACAVVTTMPPPPLPFLSASGAALQPPPVIDLDDDDVQVVPEAPPTAVPVDDGAALSNPNHVEVEQPAPPLTSVSQIKPETLRKLPPVLGREQAKKRLMAFSAMKLAKRAALAPKPTPKPAKPAKQVDTAGGGDEERRPKKRERSPLLIEKIMREEEELKEKLNLGPAAILVGNASSILSMVAMGRDTKPDPQYKPAERVVPADAEIMAAVSGEAALRSLPGGGGMTMATSGFGLFTTSDSSANKLIPAGKPKSRWDDQPPVAVSATAALTPLAAAAAAAAAALAARRSSRSRSKSRSSSRSRRRPRSPSPRRRPTKLPVDWTQFKTGGYEMDDIRLIRSDLMRRKRMSRRRQTRNRRRRHSSSRSRSSSRSGSRHSSPDAAEPADPLLQPEHEHRLISYVSIVGRSHALEFPREMIRETVAKPQLSYSESLHVFSRIKNRRQVLENVDEDRVQALRIWWSQLSVAPQQPDYPVLTKRRPWYSGECQLPDVWPPLVDGETPQPQEETNGEDREASPMETDADRANECHEKGEQRQENNVKEVCEATSTEQMEVSSTDDAKVQDTSDVPTSSEVYDPLEAGSLTPTTVVKTCEDVAPCVEKLASTEEASANDTSVGDRTRETDTMVEETPQKVDVSRESGGEASQDEQVSFKKRKKKQSHSDKKSEGKRKKKKKRAKKEEVSESSEEEEEEEESEVEEEDSAGEMVWVESTKIKQNSKKVGKDKKTRHKESKKDKKKKKKRKHETSEESESSEFDDEEEEPEMPKSNYRNKTAKSSSEVESSDEEEEQTPKKKKKKSKSKKKKKKRRRDDSSDDDDEERDDRGRGGGRSDRRSRSPDGGGRGYRRRDRSPPRRRRSPARSPPPRRRSPARSPPPRRRSPARSPHRRRQGGDSAPSDCPATCLQPFGHNLRGSPVATHGSRRARCG